MNPMIANMQAQHALASYKLEQLKDLRKKSAQDHARWLYGLMIANSRKELKVTQKAIANERAKKHPNKAWIKSAQGKVREHKSDIRALQNCKKALSSPSASVRKFHERECVKK